MSHYDLNFQNEKVNLGAGTKNGILQYLLVCIFIYYSYLIYKAHYILEAFCHASTKFNSNSTRSCQYFEISYTPEGIISGAKILNYMLEESRITLEHQNEKNFHVFYYLLAGLDEKIKKKFDLKGIENHRYKFVTKFQ